MCLMINILDSSSSPPITAVPFHWLVDLVSIGFVAALLLLSILSFYFVLRLRYHHHHHNFNSLWTVRLLLVSLISFWTLSHLLFFLHRRRHSSSSSQQASLCRFHLVLSLGLLQPAFLVTVLYLLNASVKNQNITNPGDASAAISLVLSACLPFLLLQILSAYLPPFGFADRDHRLHPIYGIFRRTSVLYRDEYGSDSVMCVYPILGTLIFAGFAITFLIGFWFSCWRAVSVVINKGLRMRIYVLAIAISMSLSTEIVFMGLSVLWRSENPSHAAAALVVFLSALSCAVAGEGMLVIRPIADALAASGGGCYGQLSMDNRRRQSPEEAVVEQEDDGGGETKDVSVLS